MRPHNRIKKTIISLVLVCSLGLWVTSVRAEDHKAAASDTGAEEVKIEQIKQRYWAGGDEAQVGVVQNRAYSKARRFSLGVDGGVAFGDPFVSTKIAGVHAGYNFSEYFSVELLYWKFFSSPSSALDALRDQSSGSSKDANINPQRSYYGAEGLWSVMYGKLSFVGRKIIYYDMHVSAGGGMVDTDNGKYPAATVGLGQRFYVSQSTSIRLDYRLMIYQEHIVEKQITSRMGEDYGPRTNWGHTITLGVDFLFGSNGSTKK